jgi:hypothetical protein
MSRHGYRIIRYPMVNLCRRLQAVKRESTNAGKDARPPTPRIKRPVLIAPYQASGQSLRQIARLYSANGSGAAQAARQLVRFLTIGAGRLAPFRSPGENQRALPAVVKIVTTIPPRTLTRQRSSRAARR